MDAMHLKNDFFDSVTQLQKVADFKQILFLYRIPPILCYLDKSLVYLSQQIPWLLG